MGEEVLGYPKMSKTPGPFIFVVFTGSIIAIQYEMIKMVEF